MKPNASTAARTSLPVRKIRTRPPKRSPPPANSSIPKPAATTSSRSKKRLRKSDAGFFGLHRIERAQARSQAGLEIYWEIGGAGGPAGAIGVGGGTEAVTAGGAG